MATAEENAQIIQQAAYEMQNFGKISAETANKLVDAKTGINDFKLKLSIAAGAAGVLADTFITYNKEIYAGSSANKAAAASLDKMADAAKYAGAFLALLVPGGVLVKGFIAGMGLLAAKSLQAGKLIAEQADDVYKGFQGLAQAGAVGKGGMQDVFNSLQKVGLGTEKFGEYLRLVNENSKDLALFGGTVMQGRKTFEDTMGSLTREQRVQMEQMGLDRTAQAEVTMQYLKQQRLLTLGTKTQMDTSSTAVMRYIKETDELTRITGLNRKEQEKVIEENQRNEAYAATRAEILEQHGEAAANALDNAAKMAAKAGPETLKKFQDSVSGFVGITDEGSKATLLSNGKNLEVAEMFRSGQIKNTRDAAQAMQGLFKAFGEGAVDFRSQAKMMNFGPTFGSYLEAVRAGQISMDDLVKAVDEAEKQRKDLVNDPLTKQAAENENAARETQLTQQRLVNEGLAAFITANGKVVEKNNDMITGFSKLATVLEEKVVPYMLKLGNILGKIVGNFAEQILDPIKVTAENYQSYAEQQKINASKMTIGEDIPRLLAKGIEGIVGFVSADLANTMAAERVTSETKMLKQSGRLGQGEQVIPARADGGPVGRGSPYLVGEEGPEIFVPSIAGDIVPLGKLTGTTGAALRQSDRIEKAVKEITLDTIEIEKITDTDAKRAKDYSKFYQTYIELRTTYEKKQMELINYQMNEGSGGGGSGGGAGAAGGSGLQLPAARSIAGMGGGQGLTKMGQGDLAQMGLMIRSKDTQAEGAGISPSLIELAKQIQSGVPGFAGFTAFNDKFHNEKAPSSQHTKGLALDFALGEKPSIETGRAITQWLRDSGASLAIDEYNNPSAGATGGHIHAQIPAFAEGGQLGAGRVGIAGEAGPELITGPASITPMNDLTRALDSMSGLLQQSVMKLDEISRATQRNGDINDKMLSYAQN